MGAVILNNLPVKPKPEAPVLFGGGGRKMYTFRQIEFFAKAGAVFMFDNRTGVSQKVDPEEIKLRAASFGTSAKRATDPQTRIELTKLANDLEECAARAIEQGSFWKEEVQDHAERHAQSTYHFHGVDLPKERTSNDRPGTV